MTLNTGPIEEWVSEPSTLEKWEVTVIRVEVSGRRTYQAVVVTVPTESPQGATIEVVSYEASRAIRTLATLHEPEKSK